MPSSIFCCSCCFHNHYNIGCRCMGQDRSNLCGIGGTGSARGADVNSSFQANQNEKKDVEPVENEETISCAIENEQQTRVKHPCSDWSFLDRVSTLLCCPLCRPRNNVHRISVLSPTSIIDDTYDTYRNILGTTVPDIQPVRSYQGQENFSDSLNSFERRLFDINFPGHSNVVNKDYPNFSNARRMISSVRNIETMVIDYSDRAFLTRLVRNKIPSVRKQIKDETVPSEHETQEQYLSVQHLNQSSRLPNDQISYRRNYAEEDVDKKKRKCNIRKWRCLIMLVVICLCVSGLIASLTLIKHMQNSAQDDNIHLPNINALVSDCHKGTAVGKVGGHICFTPKSSCSRTLETDVLKNITITQTSSKYFKFVNEYYSIVISEDKFNSIYEEWFVDFNKSMLEQPIKIGKVNLTCQDIGEYRVTLHYEVGEPESCELGIESSYPQLNLTTNDTGDLVYVICEINDLCSDVYLKLFINEGNLSYPIIGNENKECSSNLLSNRKTKEVALRKSMLSPNQTISCQPLTDGIAILENLTKTTSLCDGQQCSKTCNEDEQGYYFQHQTFCNVYYQCEYPTLHLRPCPGDQQWNPNSCTCDHAKNVWDQCNNITKRYITPIDKIKIKACGGSLNIAMNI